MAGIKARGEVTIGDMGKDHGVGKQVAQGAQYFFAAAFGDNPIVDDGCAQKFSPRFAGSITHNPARVSINSDGHSKGLTTLAFQCIDISRKSRAVRRRKNRVGV